jgi:hypothetical protein
MVTKVIAGAPGVGHTTHVLTGAELDAHNAEVAALAAQELEEAWRRVREKQRAMIVKHQDLIEIYEREVAHTATTVYSNGMSDAKYQEWLTYFQTIRVNDEATHATPELAFAALDEIEKLLGDGGGQQPITSGYNAP